VPQSDCGHEGPFAQIFSDLSTILPDDGIIMRVAVGTYRTRARNKANQRGGQGDPRLDERRVRPARTARLRGQPTATDGVSADLFVVRI
jgi:hypothetical protein